MATILVLTDPSETDGQVIYSEQVGSVHLDGDHAGALLVERLRWAVRDAQVAEHRAALDAPAKPREKRRAA